MDNVELIQVRHFGQRGSIRAPSSVAARLRGFYALAIDAGGDANFEFEVRASPDDRYALIRDGVAIAEDVGFGSLVMALNEAMVRRLDQERTLWRAGMVGWGDKAILITGEDDAVIDAALAGLIERGFSYQSKTHVEALGDGRTVMGFAGPFAIAARSVTALQALPGFRSLPSVRSGASYQIAPDALWGSQSAEMPLAIVIDALAGRDGGVRVTAADTARVARSLGRSNPRGLRATGLAAVMLERVPSIGVHFGATPKTGDAIDQLLRFIVENDLQKEAVNALLAAIAPPPPREMIYPVQERTDRQLDRKLTIAMACFDDFDGVFFSLQGIRLYHPEILDDVEFLVIDTHPEGAAGTALKDLEGKVPNYRYVPRADAAGVRARDAVFAEAAGDIVLCMDSHVLFPPDALAALMAFFAEHPDSSDLVQGPLLGDDLHVIGSHREPRWQTGTYGVPAHDPASDDVAAAAFDIPLQDLGVFACRRAAWPGTNPAFRGYGGEDGYIQEKFRRRGGRTLCLPALRWLRRSEQPGGVPYAMPWHDRFRNYLIGWDELGWPVQEAIAHIRHYMGDAFANGLLDRMRAADELKG